VAVLGDAAGELVYQLDAAGPHDVVDIALQQHRGVQGHIHPGEQMALAAGMELHAAEPGFDARKARVGEIDGTAAAADLVVHPGHEAGDHRGELMGVALARAGAAAMTSGMRASSMRIESASSTMARAKGRCTRPQARCTARRAGSRSRTPWR